VFTITQRPAPPPALRPGDALPGRRHAKCQRPDGGPILGSATRNFDIPGSACGIAFNAAAYSLNVAAVPSGRLGYLTVGPPDSRSRP
jgi:hypothetical protein